MQRTSAGQAQVIQIRAQAVEQVDDFIERRSPETLGLLTDGLNEIIG